MIYIKKIHEYSWHPVWYTLYTGAPNNPITNILLEKREEIQKWIRASRFRCIVDKKGTNYRFRNEQDLTMFILRWA